MRTQDEKGRIRFWHAHDIDLESLSFKEGEKLTVPQKFLSKK